MCYNDSDKIDFDYARDTLVAAFESVLPERSGFET